MSGKGDNWSNIVQQWLLPPRCLLCGGVGQRLPLLDLCVSCEADLPRNVMCDDGMFAPFCYAYPLDSLIPALKYRAHFCVARVLGELLARALTCKRAHRLASSNTTDTAWPDVLLPVPLHARRLRSRGFNQALEIAKPVSKRLDIPLAIRLCERVIDNPAQTRLGAAERKHNLRNAFRVRDSALPKSVAVIDDVITTGSTMQSIVMALKRQGVETVHAWAVARTYNHNIRHTAKGTASDRGRSGGEHREPCDGSDTGCRCDG